MGNNSSSHGTNDDYVNVTGVISSDGDDAMNTNSNTNTTRTLSLSVDSVLVSISATSERENHKTTQR